MLPGQVSAIRLVSKLPASLPGYFVIKEGLNKAKTEQEISQDPFLENNRLIESNQDGIYNDTNQYTSKKHAKKNNNYYTKRRF